MGASVYATRSVAVSQLLASQHLNMTGSHQTGYLPIPAASVAALPSDADVIHAITSGEGLRVAFQPQYVLRSRRMVSAEALLRWRHPQYGEVSPSVMIPMVSRLGLHLPLFKLVVTQVIDMLRCLRSIGADMPIAVNASINTVCEPGMADQLSDTMWDACLPPRLLKIDMTVDLPVSDELCLSACLNAVRAKGFPLSLDDFGAGFSTLNLLVKMPFDEVKIDRAFIRDMTTNAQSHAIVATIISLSRKLNMRLVAGGIENESTITALCRMGCHIGQGLILSRPMERTEFLKRHLEDSMATKLKVY